MRARCWQYLVHGNNSPFPVLLMLWHIQTINMRPLIWGKEYKKQPCNLLLICAPSRVAEAWEATGRWAHLDWVLDQSRPVQSSPSISCCGGGGGFGFEASGGCLIRPKHTLSNSCGSIPTIISALQSWGLKTTAYVSRQVFWCLGMNRRVRESTRRRFSSNQTEECGARERLHLQQDLRLIFAKNICIVYAKWSAASTNTEADFLQIRLPCNGLL